MSDLDEALGIKDPAVAHRDFVIKRELEKRSQDTVLVRNPLQTEHTERWNGMVYRFPPITVKTSYGYGVSAVSRFIGENYLKHMTDKILFAENDAAVDKENAKRAELGQLPMTKYMGGEQEQYENRINILKNPTKRATILEQLYIGVYEEFGKEDTLVQPVSASTRNPLHATDEFMFMFNKDKQGAREPFEAVVSEPKEESEDTKSARNIERKKKELVEELQ